MIFRLNVMLAIHNDEQHRQFSARSMLPIPHWPSPILGFSLRQDLCMTFPAIEGEEADARAGGIYACTGARWKLD